MRCEFGQRAKPVIPVCKKKGRDITQTLTVDRPSDTIRTHKVSGPNSPRGRFGGQKRLENLEKPRGGWGEGTGVGDHLGTIPHISIMMDEISYHTGCHAKF